MQYSMLYGSNNIKQTKTISNDSSIAAFGEAI